MESWEGLVEIVQPMAGNDISDQMHFTSDRGWKKKAGNVETPIQSDFSLVCQYDCQTSCSHHFEHNKNWKTCRERVVLLVWGLDDSVQQGVSGEAAVDKLQGEGWLERGVWDGRSDELIADRCARRSEPAGKKYGRTLAATQADGTKTNKLCLKSLITDTYVLTISWVLWSELCTELISRVKRHFQTLLRSLHITINTSLLPHDVTCDFNAECFFDINTLNRAYFFQIFHIYVCQCTLF